MTLLQFGVNVSTSAAPGSDPGRDAQIAERLGFDFVSASDHPCGRHPTFETWTMLTWIAARTSRIHVATRVLGVPYRAPAMVAKMAETLSRLSNGRLILGLGGGASDSEFRAFGLGVPTPAEKVTGLEDAIVITRRLWSEASCSYAGGRFAVDRAEMEPKPAHPIPIWTGSFGARSLAVTGRLADGWIPSLGMAPPDRIPEMRDRVLAAAVAAGRDPSDITCVYNVEFHIGEDLGGDIVSGRPEAVVETLLRFADLGFTAVNFIPRSDDPTQIERLAVDVLPAVRAELER